MQPRLPISRFEARRTSTPDWAPTREVRVARLARRLREDFAGKANTPFEDWFWEPSRWERAPGTDAGGPEGRSSYAAQAGGAPSGAVRQTPPCHLTACVRHCRASPCRPRAATFGEGGLLGSSASWFRPERGWRTEPKRTFNTSCSPRGGDGSPSCSPRNAAGSPRQNGTSGGGGGAGGLLPRVGRRGSPRAAGSPRSTAASPPIGNWRAKAAGAMDTTSSWRSSKTPGTRWSLERSASAPECGNNLHGLPAGLAGSTEDGGGGLDNSARWRAKNQAAQVGPGGGSFGGSDHVPGKSGTRGKPLKPERSTEADWRQSQAAVGDEGRLRPAQACGVR